MITLTPDQERHVKTIAQRKQKPIEAILDDLLTQELSKNKNEQEDHTLELFAQWEKEDAERLAKMTSEEIAAEDERDADLIRFLESNRLTLRVPDVGTDD